MSAGLGSESRRAMVAESRFKRVPRPWRQSRSILACWNSAALIQPRHTAEILHFLGNWLTFGVLWGARMKYFCSHPSHQILSHWSPWMRPHIPHGVGRWKAIAARYEGGAPSLLRTGEKLEEHEHEEGIWTRRSSIVVVLPSSAQEPDNSLHLIPSAPLLGTERSLFHSHPQSWLSLNNIFIANCASLSANWREISPSLAKLGLPGSGISGC